MQRHAVGLQIEPLPELLDRAGVVAPGHERGPLGLQLRGRGDLARDRMIRGRFLTGRKQQRRGQEQDPHG